MTIAQEMIENNPTISNTGVFQLISLFKGWRLANVPFGATVCTGATLNAPQKAKKFSQLIRKKIIACWM